MVPASNLGTVVDPSLEGTLRPVLVSACAGTEVEVAEISDLRCPLF